MSLFVCGLSHHTASVAVRESISLDTQRVSDLLAWLRQYIDEVVVLSTCNRFEIYYRSEKPGDMKAKIAAFCHVDPQDLDACWYSHQDQHAVTHLMQVTSGIDSMCVGESQITSQVKQAFAHAREVGVVGQHLEYLFQRALQVSKQVRSQTDMGNHVVSVAYLVVEIAKKVYQDLSQIHVLLVGAGETSELAALHLQRRGVTRFTVLSRSQMKGELLASRLGAKHLPIARAPDLLSEVDLVVSATSSQLPLIGKGMVETAMKKRGHAHLVMVDLAVPRDIESEVRCIDDVYLYDMDDLQTWIQNNQASRERAANEVKQLILEQSEHFVKQLNALDTEALIKAFRSQVAEVFNQELNIAKQRLARGDASDVTLEEFSRSVMKKLLHKPSVMMKQAAYDGHESMLMLLKGLLVREENVE